MTTMLGNRMSKSLWGNNPSSQRHKLVDAFSRGKGLDGGPSIQNPTEASRDSRRMLQQAFAKEPIFQAKLLLGKERATPRVQ